MPESKRHLKVFLSYASQDKPVVQELSRRLAMEGWMDLWVDEKKLLPGQEWRIKIEEAVETSDVVIICLSSNSVSKEGFVQKELRYAREISLEKPDETIFLIPLRLDDCSVPRGLRFFQWSDYFGNQKDSSYSNLLSALKLRYQQINKTQLEKDNTESSPEQEQLVQKPVPGNTETPFPQGWKDWFQSFVWRTPRTRAIALFGMIGIVVAGWMISRLAENQFTPASLPTRTATVRPTSTLPAATLTPTVEPVALFTSTPVFVPPKLGYTIVDRDEVFSQAPKLKALGELAKERYTPADRNAVNRKLTYTIDGTPDLPMFWRWYWCASTEEILKQNMEEIDVIFEADGRVISPEQLASTHYGYPEGTTDLGWCFTYSTILQDWKPGVYHVSQTTIIKSSIHDGKDVFAPGFKKWEYTIKIHAPDTELEVTDARGVQMVFVQGSKFKIGGYDAADQQPVHDVYVNSFYMDKFEVSNASYKACVGAKVCLPPLNTSSHTHLSYYENVKYEDYPVLHVNWDMANAYCSWRGARLPTEAEWEAAAQGVDDRKYAWGDMLDCTYANYQMSPDQGCVGDTSPVNAFERGISPFGVYGLTGNVWEWVSDWYSENYYSVSPPGNPMGPDPAKDRVIRGGAWTSSESELTTTARSWFDPGEGSSSIGFRCVRSVES